MVSFLKIIPVDVNVASKYPDVDFEQITITIIAIEAIDPRVRVTIIDHFTLLLEKITPRFIKRNTGTNRKHQIVDLTNRLNIIV